MLERRKQGGWKEEGCFSRLIDEMAPWQSFSFNLNFLFRQIAALNGGMINLPKLAVYFFLGMVVTTQ